jgi:hypothetical protein
VEPESEPTAPDGWSLFGSDRPEVVAAGDSHVVAMRRALDDGLGPTGLACAVAYHGRGLDVPTLTPEYWSFVVQATAGRVVAIVLGGRSQQFLIRTDPSFRVYDPGCTEPGTDEGVWVPQEVFRHLWEYMVTNLDALIGHLGASSRLLVLGTPPPKPEALILDGTQHATPFIEFARGVGIEPSDLRILPPATRLALWRIEQTMMEEHAQAAGVTFVPAPASATDADGLLLPAYSHTDATHANSRYGALMWAGVAAALEKGVPA